MVFAVWIGPESKKNLVHSMLKLVELFKVINPTFDGIYFAESQGELTLIKIALI